MALANFFGKNALAATQVLAGVTPDTLSTILGDHVLAIAFDDGAASSREGWTTLELAANLAARLYPEIVIAPLSPSGGVSANSAKRLEQLVRSINPAIQLGTDLRHATIAIVVGSTTYPTNGAKAPLVIYAGSSEWIAYISTTHPTSSGHSANPFGAAAAACFALANAFRAVFSTHLASPECDSGFALSLFDYTVAPVPSAPSNVCPSGGPDLAAVAPDLGETILGGVGAIGNATVWTLARVPKLRGSLVLVDGERITLSNLQRYVLATQDDAASATAKVNLAATTLQAAASERGEVGLQVIPRQLVWGEFLRQRRDFRIERVATAFDTVDARLAVQAALPRRILNAWTQQGDLGVSRHLAFGDTPCLGCLYPPRVGGRSEAELVAEAMVVPEPAMEIRELLYSGAPIDEEFIRAVAARRNITDDEKVARLLQFAGSSLREFYREAFCGGLILELEGTPGAGSIRVDAPVAFQSALAGVMLAAEIVIDAAGLRSAPPPPARTAIDVLRPISVYAPQFIRPVDGGCLCHDADYINAYRAKYT